MAALWNNGLFLVLVLLWGGSSVAATLYLYPPPPTTGLRQNGDAMAVGEVVRIRLRVTVPSRRERIRIGLCGSQCSVLTSWGVSGGDGHSDPAMGNMLWISKNSDIYDNANSTELKPYSGPFNFDPAPFHTFAVRRFSEHLMLAWAEVGARRSNVVALPLEPDRDRLVVFSFAGPTEFVADDTLASRTFAIEKLAKSK